MITKNITIHVSIPGQWAEDIAFLAKRAVTEERRWLSKAEMVRLMIKEYLTSKAEILPKLNSNSGEEDKWKNASPDEEYVDPADTKKWLEKNRDDEWEKEQAEAYQRRLRGEES